MDRSCIRDSPSNSSANCSACRARPTITSRNRRPRRTRHVSCASSMVYMKLPFFDSRKMAVELEIVANARNG